MVADVPSRHLALLTDLGRRLPMAADFRAAAGDVAEALSELDVSASVSAVHADVHEVLAVSTTSTTRPFLSQEMASRLVGLRIPVDGVEAVRQVVRFRQPHFGRAGAVTTLRSLAADAALVRALPSPADEGVVAAVPVYAGDRVVGTVVTWGPGCTPGLVPTLEAVAAMLSAAWAVHSHSVADRFSNTTTLPRTSQSRAAIERLIAEGSITAAVQPVIRLFGSSVVGYEALCRFPPRKGLTTPDALFGAATALNMQATVDRAALRAALSVGAHIGDAALFVNVLIGTLLDGEGLAALDRAIRDARVDPSSIVLEFSEREPVPDLDRLQRIAAELRARGFRIAVDDAGAGHASMRVVAELRPEFLKVDRSIIHAIDADRARRALVVALLSFSGHIGARLIAEGIETDAERDTLLSLGVQFGQGWLLGRPVLTHPLRGHESTEVVDAAWFARRPVSRMETAAAPSSTPETAARPAAQRSKRRGNLPQALSDAALALQSEHDPLRILGVMAEQMCRVVPVTDLAIFTADFETHRLVPVLARGDDSEQLMADSFSLDAGITGWAFGLGTPQNIPDTASHPLSRQVPGTGVVEESLLLVPLVATDRKLGIINCWRLGHGQFSERDLEAASLFAHIAASAWRNAQLYGELLNAAMTDPLTGLYNSRWLRDAAERDISRARRDGHELALLLIDLDHFKTVNDSGGHAAGDLLLQRVAARLRATVRGADAVVRLGGEEFVILLHECDGAGAEAVAEALRTAVSELSVPEGCGLPRLTASIGVAAFPPHGDDLDSLLAAADRAMYVAKRCGRDRVVRANRADAGGSVISLPQRFRPVDSRAAAR